MLYVIVSEEIPGQTTYPTMNGGWTNDKLNSTLELGIWTRGADTGFTSLAHDIGAYKLYYLDVDYNYGANTDSSGDTAEPLLDGDADGSVGADPYINPIYGKKYKLLDKGDIYRFLDNNDLNNRFFMNILCWDLPNDKN